jgi:hypothetical protein
MREERSWRVEIKWWLSAFAALMAVLSVFALIKVVLSLATLNPADLAVAGITDRYGDALGKATMWPIAAVFAFYPFMFAAALGFRLLVPTFAGAPPRVVAAIVVSWPVGLGVLLIYPDITFDLFILAMAVVWSQVMPMPKRTVLTDQPLIGGVIIGLALSAFSHDFGLEWAILWCVLRLWRGKSLEVAATAICAGIMPALFLASQIRQGAHSPATLYITIEIMVLGVIALAGFVRWQFWPEGDEDDEDEEQDEEAGSGAAAAEAAEAGEAATS